jgi:uncharacterized surface protein with fasciclin (FAS1) repeats
MRKITLALASLGALSLVACAEEPVTVDEDVIVADEMANADAMTGTITEVAHDNPDFSTLVQAVTAADLGDTLSGPGPYTVFAPTNAAFNELPEGTLENLTTNDTDTLSNILQYHVVEGSVDAATLTAAINQAGPEGYSINTVGGGTLTAMLVDGNVVLEDATGGTVTVTQTDVDASNGVIHAIDGVLMPA